MKNAKIVVRWYTSMLSIAYSVGIETRRDVVRGTLLPTQVSILPLPDPRNDSAELYAGTHELLRRSVVTHKWGASGGWR